MPENESAAPATPYKFSNEELRVLQQCNSESFFQRSLPFGTFLGVSTYFGVKAGYLQPNNKFGAVPKVVGAVILGYLAGKISYQGKCAEKLMALPDSKLGAMLRNRKRKGGFQESLTLDSPGLNKAFSELNPSDTYTDLAPSSHMDLDTDRPLNEGLDDSFRPGLDDMILDEDPNTLPPRSSQGSTSYDELRRKNREEYELKKTKPFRGVLTPDEVPSGLKTREPAPPSGVQDPPPPFSVGKSANKYGDIWEK